MQILISNIINKDLKKIFKSEKVLNIFFKN